MSVDKLLSQLNKVKLNDFFIFALKSTIRTVVLQSLCFTVRVMEVKVYTTNKTFKIFCCALI